MPRYPLPSVVRIECDTPNAESLGTGFFVNEGGPVATCLTVIERAAEPLRVIRPAFRPWKYRVLHRSEPDDLAVLGPYTDHATYGKTPAAILRSTRPAAPVPVGEQVVVYGFASQKYYEESAPQ